ncbi:uncharacterized protein PGRI_044590 [Penicillium griseofulvum]|uniref:Uncharacterized protein n=1 Tax=Penicillium patulum TaxID=5078 RepID=A0A135LP08_PENPA|nr:uncharacterized protein PGRI_044590 [Penicillium griseofulvum]KXG50692.1 hypothetical protein PGRI_044590 [Penicillium griseofulvum]
MLAMGSLTYGLSINIYGRGNAKLGDGPSHMGIAIYEDGSSTCEMHHIRNPTDEDFIYDPRTQPLEDPALKVAVSLLRSILNRANKLLARSLRLGKTNRTSPSSASEIAKTGLLVQLECLSMLVLFLPEKGDSGRV